MTSIVPINKERSSSGRLRDLAQSHSLQVVKMGFKPRTLALPTARPAYRCGWDRDSAAQQKSESKRWGCTFSSVELFSHVLLFVTPWTAARQDSLSITNCQSLPKLMSIESVMPSNHLILCRPLLLLPSIFPSIRVFQMSQLFPSSGQSIAVSASTSVLTMNTQDWSLGQTGWIALQSKGLSRVFSNTTVQKHQFFSAQLSL